MMIRPLERLSPIKRTTKPTHYGTRRSARSPALLTAVRSRRSGLAVHPRRVLHGPAAPDWRGELRVGRTRNSKDRRRIPTASRAACSTMPHWVTPVAQYVIIEPNPRRPPAVAAAPLCQITMLRRTPPPLLADGRSGAHATSCSPPPSPPLRRSSSPHCRRPSSPHCRRPSLPCGRRSPRHRRRRRRPPPPRLATVIVAVVVAATVGRRPRRRRSSLLLCRRRSPCHMSLAHRRRRLSAGVPLPRHRHPPRRRSSSPSPSLPPLGAASARPSRRRVHRPRQPCPPRPPPSHPPPTRPLSYLILSCEGGKFLNTPAFQTSRRAGLGR
jgi:hypothetical protein